MNYKTLEISSYLSERKVCEALKINNLIAISKKDNLKIDSGDYVNTNNWKPLLRLETIKHKNILTLNIFITNHGKVLILLICIFLPAQVSNFKSNKKTFMCGQTSSEVLHGNFTNFSYNQFQS